MTTTHLTAQLEPAITAEKALLYFTAPWCAPCKMFGPIIEQFKEENPNVMVVKIDIDEKRDLATLYGVRGIPTVIALEHGAEKGRHTGLTNETTLKNLVG